MLVTAFNRTWAQLLHPKFRTVFFIGIISAILVLGSLIYSLYEFWPKEYQTGFEWIDTGGFTMLATLASYVLFPPIATTVMSLMADQIADAVEDEYYPHRKATRRVPISEAIVSGLKLTLILIVVNIIAIIPYLILFALTAGVGTLLLFLTINGFLLGREYYEMVGMRHMTRRPLHIFRKENSGTIFITGFAIAGMFTIPFLNLLAPIVGAALMTHIFQFLAEDKNLNLKKETI
ncbi:EI24 domain-containing protein [Kordiimonas sp. SCSIO 12610]|uniref:EI24 domain-containing protein n=1 Tax=Kordiimonas sp. SCSIO 12610 TaxID=2829597 RepID=UPI00210BCDFC|nr:EI24 domain-containing protein [Kordiimonas sp. SCSIO 12610]UTW55571.1 EI24 domain-containing protein [Kordiimonas sp. SCSIO 12610]